VLRGLKRPVPYLSYEVNLPELRTEGLECIEILNRLDPRGAFNYAVDCRVGLVLQEWRNANDFAAVFTACTDLSIEVFWKASSA
jgi:hypothetical protein